MVGSPIGTIYMPALNAATASFAHKLRLVQIVSNRHDRDPGPVPLGPSGLIGRVFAGVEAMLIDGQCHCGSVSYEADIDPAQVSICHCTDCQSLTGSPYRVTVICSGEQIRMTAGLPKIYSKLGDNGRPRLQHFCAECGSPLFTSGEGGPDDWGIRWGSIRQRRQLKPARQIWCRSAAPWIHDLAGLPARAGD